MAEPQVPGLNDVPPQMACPACNGWGITDPSDPTSTCPSCEGTGMVDIVDDIEGG